MSDESKTYECPHHNTTQPRGESCAACLVGWETRRKADEMTGEERRAEMGRLATVTYDFGKVHQRIEELVGRPVWTHEMGLNWEGLIDEAASRQHPTMEEIIEQIPEEKRIVVVLDGPAPKVSP